MTASSVTMKTSVPVTGEVGEPVTGAGPTVLGLDLSLSCTGLAGNGWTDRIKPPAKLRGHERLAYIRRAIIDRHLTGVALVVVEGPSYGNQGSSRQSGHHERAGLWWLVTHAIWARGTALAVAPPAALKKYATGKGNAGKDDVMREVARRFPWFEGGEDEADALAAAAVGREWLGVPLVDMPKTHRMAVDGCVWPDRELIGGAS